MAAKARSGPLLLEPTYESVFSFLGRIAKMLHEGAITASEAGAFDKLGKTMVSALRAKHTEGELPELRAMKDELMEIIQKGEANAVNDRRRSLQ